VIERLKQGQPFFGVMQSIPSPTLTEIALLSGFDFIVLDREHAAVDESAQLASIQVVSLSGGFVLVRLRANEFAAVGRYLDFGVNGILMPDVCSAEDASLFVAAATHGPRGTRSWTGGGSRVQRYGLDPHAAPVKPLLLAMIEGAAGVRAIEGIVATEGLDGIVIGPHDLSADLDSPNDFSTEAYRTAFETVEAAVTRRGKILGSRTHPGFPIERLLAAGHRFILTCGDVSALRDGFHLHLEAVRGKQ
jgi:4-hydroxy-2-oxoheptanedioate aldolase